MRTIPDTKIITEASKIVKAAVSENIWNHSFRTFLYADEFGFSKELQYSTEDLMLVALFHDIGLYEPYLIRGKSFQVGSSTALKEFLLSQKQVPKEKINPMMEAIDFHFQFKPRWDKGNLAGLLQVGAHMDVLGTKKSHLPKNIRNEIKRAYPKDSFFLEFNTCLMKSISGFKSISGILCPHTCQDPNHYIL